ncbi:MAG: dihydroorotase [Muribaculaceae bacterium]|nr:dihydroorotase [Muribaculaceae bacterium]
MNLLIKNAEIRNGESTTRGNLLVVDGVVSAIGADVDGTPDCEVIDAEGATLHPGLVDVHVHLREPGFSYKETIADGSRAAAHGGFTTVCTMPNLKPIPDSLETLEEQRDIIRRDAVIEVLPYAAITRKRLGAELCDYEALAPLVAGFSDDGTGVQSDEVMKRAMKAIAATGKVLAAHCEVEALLNKGYIHDGEYARTHGHRGICSESEWKEIERDINITRETGCRLHICHISTKEGVELVRRAKKEGLPVTCETGAHYLAFCDADLREEGRFKMNPPLRSAADRDALLEGIADGTIDCIASDHAPHSAEEKSLGLEKSAMGVTGIEVSLPAVYTYAVRAGHITFGRMVELMADAPRRIFGIEGGIRPGDRADFTLVDFNEKYTVNPAEFLSKGKATPFEGLELYGVVKTTVHAGKIAYRK